MPLNLILILLCLSSGIQEWPDGSCYKGKFVGDYRHGIGQHSWPTGEACVLSALLNRFSFYVYIYIYIYYSVPEYSYSL